MEKNQISEMLAPFALSAESAKSATNRISSALEKNGTPAQLLASVSQSLNALSERADENSSDYGALKALVSAFTFSTAIAKKGADKPKKTREVWADSQAEAIALKNAQTPAKPKKAEAKAKSDALDLDAVARLLAEALARR